MSVPGISRRDAPEMAVTMGGLDMAGGVGRASAPSARRIEQVAPEIKRIAAASPPIQEPAPGFGALLGPAPKR